MKKLLEIFLVPTVIAATGLAQTPASTTAPTAAPAKAPLPPPKSLFTQPTNPHEGHDPFWPESTRIFDSTLSAAHNAEPTTLVVNGYSIVNGRPIIIINKVSFLNGDEADLPAAGGTHTHVHCLEIHTDYVDVEVNGIRRELHF